MKIEREGGEVGLKNGFWVEGVRGFVGEKVFGRHLI